MLKKFRDQTGHPNQLARRLEAQGYAALRDDNQVEAHTLWQQREYYIREFKNEE